MDGVFNFLDNLQKSHTNVDRVCDLKPESRQELGRGTWSLLHIMASTYPANPSPQTIQEHKIFFQLLPRIYPCPDCRQHMSKMFHELPPRLNSHDEFVQWICEAHNRVNIRLGKPTFDCGTHDERWDCGCGITPGKPADDRNQSVQKPASSASRQSRSSLTTPNIVITKPPKDKSKERNSRSSRHNKNGGQI